MGRQSSLSVEIPFPTSEADIWQEIRKSPQFTISYLEGLTQTMTREGVRGYVKRLEAAGIVQMIGEDAETNAKIYLLVEDKGIIAPRVKPDGTIVKTRTGRSALWHTMKIKKSFTCRELMLNAATEESRISLGTVKEYVTYLHRGGYLVITRKSQPGREARYEFLEDMNTGPLPPQILRIKALFDPNTGKIMTNIKVEENG